MNPTQQNSDELKHILGNCPGMCKDPNCWWTLNSHLIEQNKMDEEQEKAIQDIIKRARLETLDYVIDFEGKTFNRWTQKDIANFFDGVGKYYRELQQTLNKSEEV